MSEHHPRIDEAATVLARAKHLAGTRRLAELFGASDPETNARLAAQQRVEGGKGPRSDKRTMVVDGTGAPHPTRGPHWTREGRRARGKAARLARRRNRV